MVAAYHLCFVVQDVDAAARELGAVLGLTWQPVRENQLGEWETRMTFSVQGPPFVELIESRPGSPWDAGDGSRFDHLGFWSRDVATDKQRLAELGAPVDFDADAGYGRQFTYHRLASVGARLELVDLRRQPAFVENWAPQLASPMPPVDLPGGAGGGPVSDDGEACHAALVDVFASVDRGRATDALEWFADDATFEVHDRRLRGRAEIARFFADRERQVERRTRHVVANHVVRSRSPQDLTSTALLMVYVHDGDGYRLETVLDTAQAFRRTPAGWRITRRDVVGSG